MAATMHAGISDALSICLCAPLVKLGLTSGGLSSARVPRIRRLMGYQIPEKVSHTRNSTFQVQHRVNQIFTTLVNQMRRQQALIRS